MKILFALLMGMCLAAGVVQADTVKLKNGTVVEGKVIEQTSDGVKIDIGGVTLTYYADEVASVESPQMPQEASAPVDAVVPVAPVAQAVIQSPVASVPADNLDGLNKEQLIRKFVAIYGVKENMQSNFDQMMTGLKPEQAQAFRDAVKVDDIVEQLLPIYDKYFSESDLKAYIHFYSSGEGRKLVQTLPLLMNDSVRVSLKYLDTHLPESLKQPQQPVSGK